MNNRNKMLIVAGLLLVLTGQLCLVMLLTGEVYDKSNGWWGTPGHLIYPFEFVSIHDWTFNSKGLEFGLLGNESKTLMLFGKYCLIFQANIILVASELAITPVIYGVIFSWIIRLRRRMKAQSPGAGSAERPDH